LHNSLVGQPRFTNFSEVTRLLRFTLRVRAEHDWVYLRLCNKLRVYILYLRNNFMVALQLARPIDDAIKNGATSGRARFGPQPLADSRHIGEREVMTKIFIPVQAFARRLDGQSAKDVNQSDVLRALESACSVNSFCHMNIVPLKYYLGRIIAHSDNVTREIIAAARKALVNLNAIQILREERAVVNSHQSLSS